MMFQPPPRLAQDPAQDPAPARRLTRRAALGALPLLAAPSLLRRTARAAAGDRTTLRFLTSWYPQAEHGGVFQAKAAGHYAAAGLDLVLESGGPQVNGMQLLLGGAADLIMGYDIQVLGSVARGLPVLAVAASFQQDLQGIMAHSDVASLSGLGSRRILLSASAHTTFWPWLQRRYGFTDAQTGTFTFNLQPFLLDPMLAVQAYATSEPFEARKSGAKVNFFAFYDQGYPPYGNPIVTTRSLIAQRPDAVQAFVHATALGWRDYLRDPTLGNALIRSANPRMSQDRIDYALGQIRSRQVVTGGDAASQGIGVITEARWRRTADFMVQNGLLPPDTDWHAGFTTRFVAAQPVLPA